MSEWKTGVLKKALEEIIYHYPNPDMNHVDYRVFCIQTAEQALKETEPTDEPQKDALGNIIDTWGQP